MLALKVNLPKANCKSTKKLGYRINKANFKYLLKAVN